MSNFNYYRDFQSGLNAPKANGTFWLYAKIDFAKQNMDAADNLKLFKIKDKWLLLRGFTRTLVASDGNATADIGTAAGGQQLDVAQDPFAAGDWITMSVLTGTAAAIAVTADGYIYYEALEATVTSGITEVMIEVYAGLDDAEGVGSLAA
jgi:hypothetical protein